MAFTYSRVPTSIQHSWPLITPNHAFWSHAYVHELGPKDSHLLSNFRTPELASALVGSVHREVQVVIAGC